MSGVRGDGAKMKVLVYKPTNQVISSFAELEQKLHTIGWSRYPGEMAGTVQFHRSYTSNHLITLPRDFRSLKVMHLFDIVVKNRDSFEVRDYA